MSRGPFSSSNETEVYVWEDGSMGRSASDCDGRQFGPRPDVVGVWAGGAAVGVPSADSRVLGIASGIVGAFVVDGIAARLILPLAYTRPSFAVVALLAWIVGLRFAIAAFLALPTWAIIVAFFVVAFGYTARWPAKSK
jgi:hypothetical protein